MSSKLKILIVLVILVFGGILLWRISLPVSPSTPYSPISIKSSLESPLVLAAAFPEFEYEEKPYNNPEYSLPLEDLPENYQRDIVEKFGKTLTPEQRKILLENGALILRDKEYDQFENAFSFLEGKDIPIFITSDSILHLFHIEFNEILKNLEIKKLSPMLKEFLLSTISETKIQMSDPEIKELARRNLAYLSVAMKLLDPEFKVPPEVKNEVEEEIKRIEDHKGFYKSPLFSLDCPEECLNDLAFTSGEYPDGEICSQAIKGVKISYQGKIWDSVEFYKEVCTRKCYCEDYSQYVPRGHYTSSEELERYFKSMIWLGRIGFKARGESWTKQAALLTLAVNQAETNFEGKEISAQELWRKIYSVTGFFAGASDDLTFYDYSNVLNEIIGKEIKPTDISKLDLAQFQEEISKLRGPKILGGFEIDLAGNLKDLTQGMRLIGQRYALDSQILGDLVYKNVGPNPDSPFYDEVINYCLTTSCLGLPVCTQPREFYYNCQNLEQDREKYWNEVCDAAVELYCGCSGCSEDTPEENINKLWSVCRFIPTGLDVANVLGSVKAEEVLKDYYHCSYCDYSEKQKELKELVSSYTQEDWNKNLYNTWLWMLQPVLKEKPQGYPDWMRTSIWKLKDLITSLSSWAELRHDTILYVKQSYTWAAGILETAMPPMPIEAKYYGYVEPNPELFARAKYAVDYLNEGLRIQGVMTDEVSLALNESSEMMENLMRISEKELEGKALTEEDYDYIKNIDSKFNQILEKLASALSITQGTPGENKIKETSLEGKEEAFKTSLIADVHTDANSKKVLEVGTGTIDWLLVAHKSKEGRIGIAVGPMFSYYEFPWPMKDRLTDEKWRSQVLDEMERPIWYEEIE